MQSSVSLRTSRSANAKKTERTACGPLRKLHPDGTQLLERGAVGVSAGRRQVEVEHARLVRAEIALTTLPRGHRCRRRRVGHRRRSAGATHREVISALRALCQKVVDQASGRRRCTRGRRAGCRRATQLRERSGEPDGRIGLTVQRCGLHVNGVNARNTVDMNARHWSTCKVSPCQ